MKKILYIAVLFSISASTYAAGNPNIDCYSKAYSSGGLNLNASQAIALCRNVRDADAAQQVFACYGRAYSSGGLNLNSDQAIALCHSVRDAASVDQVSSCYSQAFSSGGLNLNAQQAIDLCTEQISCQ